MCDDGPEPQGFAEEQLRRYEARKVLTAERQRSAAAGALLVWLGEQMAKIERDSWITPPYVMDYASKRWGPFDLDVCATEESKQAPTYFGHDHEDPKRRNAFRERNRWRGEAVWMNPPYSKPGPWVERLWDERHWWGLAVALLPAKPDTAWWRFCHEHAARVVHIWPRVAFIHPRTGQPGGSPPGGVAFVVFTGKRRTDGASYEHVELRP